MSDNRKTLALSRPITIGNGQVSALTIDSDFRAGWLRAAPTTPTWLIAVIRSILTTLPVIAPAGAGMIPAIATDAQGQLVPANELDVKGVFGNIPTPSGEEVTEMVPWLLHMAGKATGQPADVVDQLSIADLLSLLMLLMPGMGALPNFQQTPGSGSVTSPGSSTGAPPTSNA